MEGPSGRYNVDFGPVNVDNPRRPLQLTVNGAAVAGQNAAEKNANAKLNAAVAPGQIVELSFPPVK